MTPQEEQFYEAAAREVHESDMRPGLYAKAFSESGGDKQQIAALYIKYRVKQMTDELHVQISETKVAVTAKKKEKLDKARGGSGRWMRNLSIVAGVYVAFTLTILAIFNFDFVYATGYAFGWFAVASCISLVLAFLMWAANRFEDGNKAKGHWFVFMDYFAKTLLWISAGCWMALLVAGSALKNLS